MLKHSLGLGWGATEVGSVTYLDEINLSHYRISM
jgi:hypothetical protein